jgi:hypothetical protein
MFILLLSNKNKKIAYFIINLIPIIFKKCSVFFFFFNFITYLVFDLTKNANKQKFFCLRICDLAEFDFSCFRNYFFLFSF